jgi:hypothetical protein
MREALSAMAHLGSDEVRNRLARLVGPVGARNADPCEIRPELLGLNTCGSDTLHYRAPARRDRLLTAANRINHGPMHLQLGRHGSSPVNQVTRFLEENNGV